MRQIRSEQTKRAEFERAAGEMYERLQGWRQAHPEASFDEIADSVMVERRQLLGSLLAELARQPEEAKGGAAVVCAGCGEAMRYRGDPQRHLSHREGEVGLKRAYYYCDGCGNRIFPPGPGTGLGERELDASDDSTSAAGGS